MLDEKWNFVRPDLKDSACAFDISSAIAKPRIEKSSVVDSELPNVLVHGHQVAGLRRLVEHCIDNARLRDRLVELADLATLHTVMTPWTV